MIPRPEGKILMIEGKGSGGLPSQGAQIIRLNGDGSRDISFRLITLKFYDGRDGFLTTSAVQADGKILLGGWFDAVEGARRLNLARFNTDGSLDRSFDPGEASSVDWLTVQPDGNVLVGGDYSVTRLKEDGTADSGFQTAKPESQRCEFLGLQADGRIVLRDEDSLVRLNKNGSRDRSYAPALAFEMPGAVEALATQTDGKLLIAGHFEKVNGIRRPQFARLMQDGSLDSTFKPDSTGWEIRSVTPLANGKILVLGERPERGRSRLFDGPLLDLFRLHPDGSLDQGFALRLEANSSVHAAAVRSDGKVLAGYSFEVAGQHVLAPGSHDVLIPKRSERLVCLDHDGGVDRSFIPAREIDGAIEALAVQPDDKVVVAYSPTKEPSSRGERSREDRRQLVTRLARLNKDGNLDRSYRSDLELSSSAFDEARAVNAIYVMSDGRALVIGDISALKKLPERPRAFLSPDSGGDGDLLRINRDGTWDRSYNQSREVWSVIALAGQPDGKVLVAADVLLPEGSEFGGVIFSNELNQLCKSGRGIARLDSAGKLDTRFPFLGDAWGEIRAIAVQGDGSIVVGGRFASISGVPCQSIARLHGDPRGAKSVPPAIKRQPTDQTVSVGGRASLRVLATGTSPMVFQWMKDGAILKGQTNANLTLEKVTPWDMGEYEVAVGNDAGSVLSAPAMMVVKSSPF